MATDYTYYDENTMDKVFQVIQRLLARSDQEFITGLITTDLLAQRLVTELQHEGILFRERLAPEELEAGPNKPTPDLIELRQWALANAELFSSTPDALLRNAARILEFLQAGVNSDSQAPTNGEQRNGD